MADVSVRRPAKQAKIEPLVLPANVIIQFQNDSGETTGSQLDLPHNVTTQNLETLLNGLLHQSEAQPYSFFINDEQLTDELGSFLQANKISVETVLKVVYQPQAIFRVRPIARCTASIPGHSESVLVVAFSPDGKSLASGSGDTTLRLWDLSSQLPLHTCKGHKSWVLCIAWSPDAKSVASGDEKGGIHLWDPKTGQNLGACKGHTKYITSLAWEPAHLALPSQRFCSGSKDATIRVWDASSRKCLFTMSSHTQAISCVRWGGEGHIYSAARDCSINVWSAEDGRMVRTLKGHGHWVNHLALSSEHALRTGAFDHRGHCPSNFEEAKQAAKDRYAEATGGQPERLASGSDDFTMFLWEPSQTNKPKQRLTGHLQLINHVQFSPDGRYLASASFDKAIKIWDGKTGSFVGTCRGHVGPVYQISWSSDSRLIVSGSKDSTLKVWDVATRKLKVDLPGHADEVYAVDWSPDGACVASGGKDQVLRLWRQ